MAKIIRTTGVIWIVTVIAFGLWSGFRQAFLGESGIIFESGYGEVWLLALIALPGYGLTKLATKIDGREPGSDSES